VKQTTRQTSLGCAVFPVIEKAVDSDAVIADLESATSVVFSF